jgi:hypothetical protein
MENEMLGDTMGNLQQQTLNRTKLLRPSGYTVVECYKCEWKQLPLFKRFFNYTSLTKEVDAYYGSRTEAFKLYRRAGPNEKICYLDICLLYPTVRRFFFAIFFIVIFLLSSHFVYFLLSLFQVMYHNPYPQGHPCKII